MQCKLLRCKWSLHAVLSYIYVTSVSKLVVSCPDPTPQRGRRVWWRTATFLGQRQEFGSPNQIAARVINNFLNIPARAVHTSLLATIVSPRRWIDAIVRLMCQFPLNVAILQAVRTKNNNVWARIFSTSWQQSKHHLTFRCCMLITYQARVVSHIDYEAQSWPICDVVQVATGAPTD